MLPKLLVIVFLCLWFHCKSWGIRLLFFYLPGNVKFWCSQSYLDKQDTVWLKALTVLYSTCHYCAFVGKGKCTKHLVSPVIFFTQSMLERKSGRQPGLTFLSSQWWICSVSAPVWIKYNKRGETSQTTCIMIIISLQRTPTPFFCHSLSKNWKLHMFCLQRFLFWYFRSAVNLGDIVYEKFIGTKQEERYMTIKGMVPGRIR